VPCGEHPDDCGAVHLAPLLDLRATHPGQWSGPCPACRGERKFSLATGTRGRRFVWTCHRKPSCTPSVLHEAMLAAGVSQQCLGSPQGKHHQKAAVSKAELASWVELPRPAIQIRLVMASLDCGPWEAAAKLGLSRSATYRAISPRIKADP
jgi:hypothetical protein